MTAINQKIDMTLQREAKCVLQIHNMTCQMLKCDGAFLLPYLTSLQILNAAFYNLQM